MRAVSKLDLLDGVFCGEEACGGLIDFKVSRHSEEILKKAINK